MTSPLMDPRVAAVLAAFDERAAREGELMRSLPTAEGMARRDEWLIHVGDAAGRLLNLLVREAKATRILELGTAYGYSTVWLAEAARATGGRVTSLEIHPGKQAQAREALTQAGLAEQVDFQLGDACSLLDGLDGPFDFVLIDLWKELYIPCFDRVWPKLAAGGFIAADNMRLPPVHIEDAERYRAHVRSTLSTHPGAGTVLLPVGSGIELTRKDE